MGSHVSLLNHDFTVSGIVAHGKGARFFIPLQTAQDIAGAEKRVSMFYVRSKGDTEGTRAAILKLAPLNSVRSLSEYVSLMTSSNLPQLRPFTRTMVALGIVISFLVVLLNMHTLVMERTREIGILKALGFSRFDVVRMLLGETFIITLMGTALGILATFRDPGHFEADQSGADHSGFSIVDFCGGGAGFCRCCHWSSLPGAEGGGLRSGCGAGVRVAEFRNWLNHRSGALNAAVETSIFRRK